MRQRIRVIWPGLRDKGEDRLAGRSHSPERLGIGHGPRPVNVQVSAAVGRGESKGGIGVDPNTVNW